jgi:hypothetical protein
MRGTVLLVVSLMGFSLPAGRAEAQSTRRPDLGLFGAFFRDPAQVLTAGGTLGVTFFEVLHATASPNSPTLPTRGWGGSGSADLTYRLRLQNLTLDGSVGAFATYYPDLAKPLHVQYFPGGNMTGTWAKTLSPRTRFSLGSSLNYRPMFLDAVSPLGFTQLGYGGQADTVFLPPDVALFSDQRLMLNTTAMLSHQLSTRLSVSGDYAYRRDWSFGDALADPNQWHQSAGSALHFRMTRHLSLRGGYRYSETRRSGGTTFRAHQTDIGVDYARGLSLRLTRQTTVTFHGGASAVTDGRGHQAYRLNGQATLVHEMGRTWSASTGYDRGVDSTEILFQEPVLYDRVFGGVRGQISRRVGARADASLSRDRIGLSQGQNAGMRGQASAALQTAITRYLAFTLDYALYYHSFQSQVVLPSSLRPRSASHGVRAYVMTMVPLFQRGRRPNAAG